MSFGKRMSQEALPQALDAIPDRHITIKIQSLLSRFVWTNLLILFSSFQLFSQENEPDDFFYKFIQDDSIMMFFNERNWFTDKPCSDYTRYISIDTSGYFNSYFEDFTTKKLLVGKGTYAHAEKHGFFETYYPNGKTKVRAFFQQDRPAGQWEYFYENGLPERTLKFTDTDTLLIRFIDKNGNITVTDGNGEFNGYVAGFSKSNLIMAKGKVVNGKPHDKWSSTTLNNTYCNEEFNNGKFIRGSFPNAAFNKSYNDLSELNTFLLGNYFEELEEFQMERCANSPKLVTSKKYTFDMPKFRSDLGIRMDQIIENDLRNRNTQDYSVGDHYLTIQFSVNKDGKPEKFSTVTPWGQQYFHAISNSISKFGTFPPQKMMYFHLKFSINGGFVYSYRFIFSSEISNDL